MGPWIKADIENLILIPGHNIEAPVHFVNIGKTAARHLIGLAYVESVKWNDAPSYEINVPGVYGAGGTLFPTDKYNVIATLLRIASKNAPRAENVKLTPDMLRDFNNGAIYFVVYGIAEYVDTYDVPHWLVFCLPTHAGPYFCNTNCARHNDTDNNWSQERNKTPRPF